MGQIVTLQRSLILATIRHRPLVSFDDSSRAINSDLSPCLATQWNSSAQSAGCDHEAASSAGGRPSEPAALPASHAHLATLSCRRTGNANLRSASREQFRSSPAPCAITPPLMTVCIRGLAVPWHIRGTSARDPPRNAENRQDLSSRSDDMPGTSTEVRDTLAQDPAYRPAHPLTSSAWWGRASSGAKLAGLVIRVVVSRWRSDGVGPGVGVEEHRHLPVRA